MIRIVSWNINTRRAAWDRLLRMDADVALLQEVGNGRAKEVTDVYTGPREHWDSHVWNSCWYKGRFRHLLNRWPMVVKLSEKVEIEWFKQVSPISLTEKDEIAVSGIGTIAAARVIPKDAEPFIAVSMYARWKETHTSVIGNVTYPDGSAHCIISDLSTFIGNTDPSSHRILAAGDLNMTYGTLDNFPKSLALREQTVWDRMQALGLEFLGPQLPHGRKAKHSSEWLPSDTKNVPTYYSAKQKPETAKNQLDYVFASRGFHEGVKVRALNEVECWGPSDHCRLLIEVDA